MTGCHTFRAIGKCPNNSLLDHYMVEVFFDRLILCEELLAAANRILETPQLQELFTQALADQVGMRVRTTCHHLEGGKVKTICECEPETGRR